MARPGATRQPAFAPSDQAASLSTAARTEIILTSVPVVIGAAHIGAWVVIGLGVGVVVGVTISDPELAMTVGAIAGAVIGLIQARRARSEEVSE